MSVSMMRERINTNIMQMSQDSGVQEQIATRIVNGDLPEGVSLPDFIAGALFGHKLCHACGKSDPTTRCSACITATYCDKACQRAHWRRIHKAECESMRVPGGEQGKLGRILDRAKALVLKDMAADMTANMSAVKAELDARGKEAAFAELARQQALRDECE